MIPKILFAILFVGGGVCHFRFPEAYLRIMPPLLPQPALLVQLSGAAEIFLGLLLLVPRWSHVAGWGLIALLFAVFPANIYMAIAADRFPSVPSWLLWLRLPLQGVFIAWAWRYAKH